MSIIGREYYFVHIYVCDLHPDQSDLVNASGLCTEQSEINLSLNQKHSEEESVKH